MFTLNQKSAQAAPLQRKQKGIKVYRVGGSEQEVTKLEEFCSQNGWEMKEMGRIGRPGKGYPVQKILDTFQTQGTIRGTARALGIPPGTVGNIVGASRKSEQEQAPYESEDNPVGEEQGVGSDDEDSRGEKRGRINDLEAGMKYEMRTKNYPLDEVVSALQKCIRRGWEELALYWAYEMVEGGYQEYMWRRLMVIASEDIGVGDNFAAVLVNALFENSKQLIKGRKKHERADYLQIAHAVLYLCRASKSRYVDDFGCYILSRREQGWIPDVPDVAIDCHTRRGRAKGRNDIDFCVEGCILSDEVEVEGPDYRAKNCTTCKYITRCEMGNERSKLCGGENEEDPHSSVSNSTVAGNRL